MSPAVKAPSRRVVVRVDLRGDAQAVLDRVPLEKLIADELSSQGLEVADSSRALVIGDAAAIPEQIETFQRIRSAGGFSRTLFLLFGEPPGEQQGADRDPWVLNYPPLPNDPGNAGVVWAGSTRGIGWRPGRSDVLTRSGQEDNAQFAAGLIEILALPAIFDGVLDELGRLPTPVAGLGVQLVMHDVPDAEVRRALRQASRQLSGTDGSGASGRSSQEPIAAGQSGKVLELLIGKRRVEKITFEHCVTERSPLRKLEDECVAVLREVDYAAAQLSRPATLLLGVNGKPAAVALTDASDALGAYRAAIEDALVAVDGSVGLESSARAYLNGLDVRIPEVPQLTARAIDTALDDEALACLDRRMPLSDAAAHLADLDGRIAPVGSAARLDELEQACPSELLERMTAPHPFPIRPPGGGSVVAAAGCGLLAGLMPQIGLVAGPVIALLGAGGLALAAQHSPERGRGGRPSPGTIRHAVAGLVGAAAGIAVGLLASPPKAAGLAGVVIALALTLFIAAHRWTSAVTAWRREAGIDEAHSALVGLRGVLEQAVLGDWLLADPKYRAANRASALGGLLQRIADGMEDAVEELTADTPGKPRAQNDWGGLAHYLPSGRDSNGSNRNGEDADGERGHTASDDADELRTMLVDDLADLAADVMLGYLPRITRSPEAVDQLPVEDDVYDAVERLRRHQEHDGVAEPPAFSRRSGERPDTVRLAGVDPARVRQAIAVGDDSAEVTQLCTRDQLRMLNREPGASRWVRFAHRSLQEAEQSGAAGSWNGGRARRTGDLQRPAGRPADYMAWLSSSRFAGALRLTPLQYGAAKTIRASAGRPGTEVW